MKIIERITLTPEFAEINETFCSIFSVKLKAPLLVWIGGFSIGSISGFVENWLHSPAVSFYALVVLIFADHLTGVCLAWKRNNFQTRKFLRIFWTLLSHCFLLYFSMQLGKGAKSLFWLNEAVFVPLVLVNLLSLVKNLSLLGFIKKDLASILYKKIDIHKNEDQKKGEK
tara:strand:+ start:26401 stop:26910 length:510 start_codon:yes stop_codon:yes gene_type:complete